METTELEKKQVYTWLNKQIKANKLQRDLVSTDSKFNYVSVAGVYTREVHISGVLTITKILNIDPIIVEWDGNKQCNTDYLEASFYYRGYKFFQLLNRAEAVDFIDFIEENENDK